MKKSKIHALVIITISVVLIVGYLCLNWPESPSAYVNDVIEVKRNPDYFGNPTPGGGAVNPNRRKSKEEKGTMSSSPMLSFDDSNLREVAGFADDVIVGKVVKMTGTRQYQGLVFTHYDVDVISTLKGGLKGTVEVTQQGGVLGGEWVMYAEKEASLAELGDAPSENQLVIGELYRLATLRNDVLKTNLLLPTKVSFVSIEVDERLDSHNLQVEVDSAPEVMEMIEAVANQILPKHKLK